MKKFLPLITLAFVTICNISNSQCPTMLTAMVNGCPGTPVAEGSNEWSIYQTGASAMNIADFRFGYGTPPAYSTMTINGSTAGVWTTQPGTLSITSTNGCTITNITSGSIPANSKFLMIPSTTTLTSLDITGLCTGGTVYTLFFNTASAGVSGFSAAGVFANTPTTARGFRITDVNTATCNGVFTNFDYINGWATNADGNTLYFPGPAYNNDGCTTILLLGFNNLIAYKNRNTVTLNWDIYNDATTTGYSVEKSMNASNFNTIGILLKNQTGKYNFVDVNATETDLYYRVKKQNVDGTYNYSEIKRIKLAAKGNILNVLYPNSTSSTINVQLTGKKTENITINILDMAGKIVVNETVKLLEGVSVHNIDVATLQSGLYIVQVVSSSGKEVSKFIKK